MTEEHRHASRCSDFMMMAHLAALIPRQRASQSDRQRVEFRGELITQTFRTRWPVKVNQDRLPGAAINECPDRGTVERTHEEIAFPMAGDSAFSGFGGAFLNHP